MEVSVQKCGSPDFPQQSTSVDLKTVCPEKPRSSGRESSAQEVSTELESENSSPFGVRREPADGARRKRGRKEASLSSLGAGIVKKRRNGLNSQRQKLNGDSSGVGMLERPGNGRGCGDGLQNFLNDSALHTSNKNNNETLSIGNSGSTSGLGDGVVIPRKPRGVLRLRKIETADGGKRVQDEYAHHALINSEPLLNELPSGVGSPSQVPDSGTKKISSKVKDQQPIDVTTQSHVSNGRWGKKSTADKEMQPVIVPSYFHSSDVRRKKKPTKIKEEQSTDLASGSHMSHVLMEKSTGDEVFANGSDVLGSQRKKKSSGDRSGMFATDVASNYHVSDCKGKKKCTGKKSELSTDAGALSQTAGDKETEKTTEVENEASIDVAAAVCELDGKRKKESSGGNNNDTPTNVASSSQVLDRKRKRKLNKENGVARDTSIPCIKGGKCLSRSNKNNPISVREDHVGNGTLLAEDVEESYGDFLEDDLEQNAARMLSSRFDPSCTGFSRSRVSTLSKLKNRGNFRALPSDSSPVDAAGRMLRPRSRNGKSLVRKRRHFYEVSYRDMDPYCIIKQRIRVFWPLDQSWYFGLVKDYDPETRLHHVKYDDRDEEWINLQNERFKLLLFPSEISGKRNSGKPRLDVKPEDKNVEKTVVNNSSGNCTESEPIIAWLMRSKNHRKLSTMGMIKKKRTHHPQDYEPSVSLELRGHSGADPSSSFPKLEDMSEEVTSVRRNSSFSDRELSFVYFRKKYHKRKDGVENKLEGDSLHGSSAASINILASVADSAAVLEELDLFGSLMELKQVTLRLNLPLLPIQGLLFEMRSSCRALLLARFGTLTSVWPTVRMEIVIVDNVTGLKLLFFEGSLRCAAVLLCLIITSFSQHSKENKFEAMPIPFSSVGINLYGLHDKSGKLLIFVYRFLDMQRLKWSYLEEKLKRKCVTMQEISLPDFTSSTIKKLQNETGQTLCTSIYKDASSVQNFEGQSCSGIIPVNPTVCYIDGNYGEIHPYSLSFAPAPSFSLSFHIKSLIKNTSTLHFEKHSSSSFQESNDNHDKLTVNDCPEDPSDQVSDITLENSGKLSVGHPKVATAAGECMRSSHNSLKTEVNISGNSVGRQDKELNGRDETVRIERLPSCTESSQDAEKSSSSFPDGYSSPEKSEAGYGSYMINASSWVGQIDQSNGREMNGNSMHSVNPTAPRSARQCNGNSSASPRYGHNSKSWSEDFMRNGFISSSKKPRTEVSYSLPFGGFDLGSKRRSHQRKPRSYKNIKTDDGKRLLGVSANSLSFHGPLTCDANILVTVGDKGWRECGAQVVMESDDQKDWRICVKFSGLTKFAYKAQHILQPGITNRHTHAMMWKGGKDWTLEFTDRSQWSIFKEIYEECFNRNMRAAHVKNIPIPGVRLIADDDCDEVVELPFVRSSPRYYRQFGTEVDVALDPSRLLYDMDTDDEEWVTEMRKPDGIKGDDSSELTEDIFERVMDIFEKFSYAQKCEEFSSEEIEEFMCDVGPLDIVKTIYEYWRQKRLKKGVALIRQFQPALWLRYEQQLKEWELNMSRMQCLPDSNGGRECLVKKPPMFAFCLRPRGLEVPNKLTKQRSHKKLVPTASHSAFGREQEVRRTNGIGEDRALIVSIPNYESSDSFQSNDSSERFQSPEPPQFSSKKRGPFPSPRDPQMMPFSLHRKFTRHGVDAWSPRGHELSSMSQIQRDGLRRNRASIDEFKLRDASGAANHALAMARMKREKSQWLIHKADLALHKASVALMIAEAMKESKEGDELSDEESDDDI